MGHQSSFYMTPKDAVDFEEFLRKRTDFLVLLDRSPSATPRIVDTLNFVENGEPWYHVLLIRPEDLGEIRMRYIQTQGYWSLNANPSPVVELSRGPFNEKEGRLRRGRIYYVDKFWTKERGDEEKSEDFRKWAKMVHSTLKKFLKRRDSKYVEYIGPDAKAWLDAGKGQLEDGFGKPVTW